MPPSPAASKFRLSAERDTADRAARLPPAGPLQRASSTSSRVGPEGSCPSGNVFKELDLRRALDASPRHGSAQHFRTTVSLGPIQTAEAIHDHDDIRVGRVAVNAVAGPTVLETGLLHAVE